ncbi:MAG: DUF91 domain-containing protein [Anaerolineales bacterium]|nr:DUF91 domain-containing protein [Anaerolineales bacterium]
MTTLWKIFCEENRYPGLWQHWYKNQCVAIGWPPPEYQINKTMPGNKGWNEARNAVLGMEIGDYVVVALKGNQIGRLGQITDKKIKDEEWDELVPKRPNLPVGEVGRRILVRWELITGPDNMDFVVQLPEGKGFKGSYLRKTIARIEPEIISLDELRSQMNNLNNWVNLHGKFSYEKALSDYIASYPHHLENGLLTYPDSKVQELVFKDKTRLDVLLMDKQEDAVIVECKQNAPTSDNFKQLRGYMQNFKNIQPDKQVRGILVHGGAQKISEELLLEAKQYPPIEIVSYTLDVNFRPSSA